MAIKSNFIEPDSLIFEDHMVKKIFPGSIRASKNLHLCYQFDQNWSMQCRDILKTVKNVKIVFGIPTAK